MKSLEQRFCEMRDDLKSRGVCAYKLTSKAKPLEEKLVIMEAKLKELGVGIEAKEVVIKRNNGAGDNAPKVPNEWEENMRNGKPSENVKNAIEIVREAFGLSEDEAKRFLDVKTVSREANDFLALMEKYK